MFWQKTLLPAFLLAIVGLTTLMSMACSKQAQRTVVIQLPANFTGQVHVEMGVLGAPPLPREGNNYVIRVPADGKVVTSTVIVDGEPKFSDVPENRVWGYGKSLTKTGDGVPVGGSIEVFIGTQEQYKTSDANKHKSYVEPTLTPESAGRLSG